MRLFHSSACIANSKSESVMLRLFQRKLLFVGCLLLCLKFFPPCLSAQATTQAQRVESRRLALLIGNSSYQKNALPNPVNDAVDFGNRLAEAGFQTVVKTDLDLRSMEKAVRDFSSGLIEGDTALVFYAGHGVESNGINYLIPIDNANLESEGDLKYKAYAATRILEEIAGRRAGLLILILDACRDNPFPSRSGTGSRGLSVMAAPPSLESIILYSTSPGTVAADGLGRNSVFIRSLLVEMQTPDLSVRDVFDRVGGAVRAATNGSQVPWLNSTPLSKPFVFFSGQAAEARLASLSAAVEKELLLQRSKIAEIEDARSKAKNEASRQKLDTELATARALENAKRLERERLATESARLAEERLKAETAILARKKFEASETTRAAIMKEEADKLKKEYESLVRADDSAPEFIRQIHVLEKALKGISDRYADLQKEGERGIQAVYAHKSDALKASLFIEPWENERDFQERTKASYTELDSQRERELATYRLSIKTELEAQQKDLKDRHEKVSAQFASTIYSQSGKALVLKVGIFDRDAKLWPIEVESTEPAFNFKATVKHSIANVLDIGSAYRAFDAALKAEALVAEIDYFYVRESGNDYVPAISKEVRIRDLTTGVVILAEKRSMPLFVLSSSSPVERLTLPRLSLIGGQEGTIYTVNGSAVVGNPVNLTLLPGPYSVSAAVSGYKRWSSLGYLEPRQGLKLEVLQEKAFFMEMVEIQGGTFSMGSNTGDFDEKPIHQVSLSSFMIGQYEVTQEQYEKVLGYNPSKFRSNLGSANLPVENVTWYDAVEFCNQLSEIEGFNKVYTISITFVEADFSMNGYRLPTEAEWEFAARGGSLSRNYTYAGSNDVGQVGWYNDNSGKQTRVGGTKAPNELGIYDMSGNVLEWCWDWYGSYEFGQQSDPIGAFSGGYRVLRGGSWDSSTAYLRSAFRSSGSPDYRSGIGFRVARRP
jgi:formylglycine-generating enzyme required for sulfatase activity/uncharacterized caspase-like protein